MADDRGPGAGDGPALPERVRAVLGAWRAGSRGPVVALTGAGISAESGIPTFRGPEGYWTIGSRNYRPEQFATRAAFRRMPETVWEFYLERIARHRDAEPNAGHTALVELEARLGDRFTLVTQNVDGLHRRAGQSVERTFSIHGDLDRVRCADDCGAGIAPFPGAVLDGRPERTALGAADVERLTCRTCGGWLRPHVLWFDECYDEEHFRFESSLAAVQRAGLLLVVGTSGSTTLPSYMVQVAHQRGIPLLVVGTEPSPFSAIADHSHYGAFLRGRSGAVLPVIVRAMLTS